MKNAILVQFNPTLDDKGLVIKEISQTFIAENDQTRFQLKEEMSMNDKSIIYVFVNGFKLVENSFQIDTDTNTIILPLGLLQGTIVDIVKKTWADSYQYFLSQRSIVIPSTAGTTVFNLLLIGYSGSESVEVYLNGLKLNKQEFSISDNLLSVPNMLANQELEIIITKVLQ